MWQKVDFIQLAMISWVVGPRRSYEALSKANLAQKKGHGHYLLVCCLSDPLQLSESLQNHYIWEVCSANWRDAPKIAMPNFLLQQCPTIHHTTNTSKVEQIGLQSFASSTIFTWPLTTWLPLLQASPMIFCRENASAASRRQKNGFQVFIESLSTDFYTTGIN